MSEKQKNTPIPLPRFRPTAAHGLKTQPVKTMKTSYSMPNLASLKSNTPKTKKEEKTPQRPQRKERRIEFSSIVTPVRKNVETYNTILPKSRSEIVDTHFDDMVEAAENLAVTLPLFSSDKELPSAADILNTSKDEKVILIQLPSALPIQYPNDSAQMEYNPLFSAADGHIGKLYVHKSGKVTAKIGNIELDVSSGIAPSCNDIMCIKREKGIDYFPVPGEKLKFSVDIDSLLNSK